ncbi:MAG: putative quinol monooxygenase [Bacteroidota bacterium]|jgi:quinol monooxygenase YgiN|nr:antibiotic biosynthesis monooxygenase [Bacteroidota bacterium]MCA6443721.1 antibiotic biosynthesis monooxygenase [Bacteroidota bacterium]
MIHRIVKLTFKEEHIPAFKKLFEDNWREIKNQKGCFDVKLLQDKNNPGIFFTYSLWDSEVSIENYKNSELFKFIWPKTKSLFGDKPEAWSTEVLQN